MSDCLFCRIIRGELPSKKAYEDDRCVVIHDIQPGAPVHLLVLPRKHIPTMTELEAHDAELGGHLLRVGAKVAEDHGVTQSGYRLVFNNGPDAGQSVFHIHLHVIGGRALGWPPG